MTPEEIKELRKLIASLTDIADSSESGKRKFAYACYDLSQDI